MPSILSIPRRMLRQESGNALLKIETSTGSQTTFVCQFNPDELHIEASGNYKQMKRHNEDTPIIQFAGRSCSEAGLKLFFDTSTSYELKTGMTNGPKKEQAKDVSVYTDVLMSLVCIEGKVHHPPLVTFQWGSLRLTGFVQNVDVKYTMFEKEGMPVRAEVSLKLICREQSSQSAGKRSHKESPDRTKCIVMTSGSSLWEIAEREYGDAAYWRDIANANHIMNPLEVPAGTYLKVPAQEM